MYRSHCSSCRRSLRIATVRVRTWEGAERRRRGDRRAAGALSGQATLRCSPRTARSERTGTTLRVTTESRVSGPRGENTWGRGCRRGGRAASRGDLVRGHSQSDVPRRMFRTTKVNKMSQNHPDRKSSLLIKGLHSD